MARRLAWLEGLADPQVVLAGELYDLVEAALYLRAGQNPPSVRIVQRLGQQALAEGAPREEKASRQPERRVKTAAEIRAQLGL